MIIYLKMLKFFDIFFKHATGIKFATYQKFSVFGYVLSKWLPKPIEANQDKRKGLSSNF